MPCQDCEKLRKEFAKQKSEIQGMQEKINQLVIKVNEHNSEIAKLSGKK